ncbi:MAG: PP2C family serine/threonine-protein phosphatase [Candidatus Woesearchaeota archaeon]
MGNKNQWSAGVISIASSRHSRECQDANHLIVESDTLILALADGAGSAKHGEKGAKIATKIAAKKIFEYVNDVNNEENISENKINWEEKIYNAAKLAKEEIKTDAIKEKREVSEYATTLILVLAYLEELYILQIGDGAVIGKNNKGDIISLTNPVIGEYFNMTDFLTSDDSIKRAEFKSYYNSISSLSAFTDGIQLIALSPPNEKVEAWEPFNPFFTPLFNFIEECDDKEQIEFSLKKFLTSGRIKENTEDDLTLFLASLHD